MAAAAPAAEAGCLQPDLAAAEAKKAQGTRLFKLGDWAGADDAYAEAVVAVPGGAAVWPAAESLLVALRANRAMCLLKAGNSEAAVEQCDKGLALPGVIMETSMHAKLLARKMEALLICDPPNSDDAMAVYCEARNRGLLNRTMKGKGTRALVAKFDSLVARLHEPVPAEHKVERTAPLKELISMLLSCQKTMPATEGDMIVEIFETMLNGGGAMEPRHVCAVDPVGKGTLMWALGCGFSGGPSGALTLAECNAFLPTLKRILEVFVMSCGAPIDQRMEHGKTLLMFMCSSGCLGAVEHVLSLGANVHMRDSEAWTPLMIACRGDEAVKPGPGSGMSDDDFYADRVAIIHVLVDAGADLDAANNNGLTALHLASLNLKPRLVKTLLDRGARADINCGGALGTPLLCAMQQRELNPAAGDECIALVKIFLADGDLRKAMTTPDDEVLKAIKYCKEFTDPLVKLANEWKAKLDDEFRNPVTGELPEMNSVGGHKSAAIQEQEIMKGVLEYFNMDSDVVTAGSCETNWYLEVHEKVMTLIPRAYTKVYPSAHAPSEAEWAVLTSNELAEPGSTDPEMERRAAALVPHPLGYGWISKTFVSNFHTLLGHPMAHTAGFAVPNQAAVDTIAALSPIIEVGAGTGYWAALLRHAGADVVAFDEQPPALSTVGMEIGNRFFNRQFTEVLQADSVSLFQQRSVPAREHSHRALLMIFPENPLHVAAGEYESWDAHCVEAYHAAGGQTVIYVGDRPETTLAGGPYACGETSSEELHRLLAEKFELSDQVQLPNWPYVSADVTVWKRSY